MKFLPESYWDKTNPHYSDKACTTIGIYPSTSQWDSTKKTHFNIHKGGELIVMGDSTRDMAELKKAFEDERDLLKEKGLNSRIAIIVHDGRRVRPMRRHRNAQINSS